jgi:putative ABC transport system permease protein
MKRSPLRKRVLRELKSDFGKYAVIFLLLVTTIGFVSGFLVADTSMIRAYEEGYTKYKIEDGNFRVAHALSRSRQQKVEALGVTLYENFYVDESLDNGSTLRIYADRTEVNLVCLMQGQMPQAEDEIAIDRMYADNNGLTVGDTLSKGSKVWKISGLVALPDYSCLFEDNSDSMFDSVLFGVAIVPKESFDALKKDNVQYNYSWKYKESPSDEDEERTRSDDLLEELVKVVSLENYVPRYQNQAITFTRDDMGSDRAMMIALLYIVIAIMAFVFGVTTSNTISKEANVIGTLRASGYTRGELVRHYLASPVWVTLLSAVIGNVLGYTVMKEVCVEMYYQSYSLPTYETVWNAQAFLLTTVIPIFLMVMINLMILYWKLSLSPLKLIRRDLKRKEKKRTIPLSVRIPFFTRFRLRVIFQNWSNYVILLVGILFANLLLMFGLIFPALLSDYQEKMQENVICNYQYFLKMPYQAMDAEHMADSLIELLMFEENTKTKNEDAEKFSAYSLETMPDSVNVEDVTLYGIKKDSRYIPVDTQNGIYISSAFADKFLIKTGDMVTLKEPYEDTTYTFEVAGVYDYIGAVAVFMDQKTLNEAFDLGSDYFCGYFSDTQITDIDADYIGTVIDIGTLTKLSRQLTVSMGGMMSLVNAFAVLIFVVLVYLLSKIVIEKNATSISMTKILGYTNREISRLYLFATTIVVIGCILLSLPIETTVMNIVFRMAMVTSISGWIPFYVDSFIYVEMAAVGVGSYLFVALLEYRKVRQVPMEEALKHVE